MREGVKRIEKDAFKGCVSLKSAVIPDSVEALCEDAFRECVGLEELRLGSGLKTIA